VDDCGLAGFSLDKHGETAHRRRGDGISDTDSERPAVFASGRLSIVAPEQSAVGCIGRRDPRRAFRIMANKGSYGAFSPLAGTGRERGM
jgi:hypothetical protein